MRRFADGMAARTRFFDDFFTDAGSAGIRQAVILASGLDARGVSARLAGGTLVFEIDQPEVIAFKTRQTGRARRRAHCRTTHDRRRPAPGLARSAHCGRIRPTRPTAWIAEGLFGYLPPAGQDRLLDQITELSARAAGSVQRGCRSTTTSTPTRSASA